MTYSVQPFSSVGFGSIGEPEYLDLTGLSATGAVGSVGIDMTLRAFPTGVSGTGALGSVTINLTTNISLTGLSATSSLGSVGLVWSSSLPVSGVVGTGNIGDNQTVNVWGEIMPSTTTTWTEIAA